MGMRLRRPLAFFFGSFALVIVAIVFASLEGYRVNFTPSVPRGLYRISEGPIEPGVLVITCLPEQLGRYGANRRYVGNRELFACPGGASPVMKAIAGDAGDTVVVSARRLEVNGQTVTRWERFPQDPFKPTDLPATWRLGPGEVWLHGVHPQSWDSRHYGPVPLDPSTQVLRPVWVEASDLLAQFTASAATLR